MRSSISNSNTGRPPYISANFKTLLDEIMHAPPPQVFHWHFCPRRHSSRHKLSPPSYDVSLDVSSSYPFTANFPPRNPLIAYYLFSPPTPFFRYPLWFGFRSFAVAEVAMTGNFYL
jgi:hypothetical protein